MELHDLLTMTYSRYHFLLYWLRFTVIFGFSRHLTASLALFLLLLVSPLFSPSLLHLPPSFPNPPLSLPPAFCFPKSWRSVRVFVSSTFRDMHAERDVLVRSVFPELRRRAAPHRLYLQEVELRWGVTEEESERAAELCLSEVCRSQMLVGILGERYGLVHLRPALPDLPQYSWVRRLGLYSCTIHFVNLRSADLKSLLLSVSVKGHSIFCSV